MGKVSTMKYAVDRIEGKFIVLENIETNEIINIPASSLPEVKEGDIVIYENNTYRIDQKETESRLNSIKERMNKLRGDDE